MAFELLDIAALALKQTLVRIIGRGGTAGNSTAPVTYCNLQHERIKADYWSIATLMSWFVAS
jgi:hypothetical protein